MIPNQTPEAEARRRTLIVVAVILISIPVVLAGVNALLPMIRASFLFGRPTPVAMSAVVVASMDPTVKTEVWRVGSTIEVRVEVSNATSETFVNVAVDKLEVEGLTPAGVPAKIGAIKPHSSAKVTFVVHKPFTGKSELSCSVDTHYEQKSTYSSSSGGIGSYSTYPVHEAAKPGLKSL